jgi:hypothetical protein
MLRSVAWPFIAAVLTLGLPVLALGAALAPLCGDDDAAWALGPVAALGIVLAALEVLSRFGAGGWYLTAAPLASGAVGVVVVVRRRLPFLWIAWPAAASGVCMVIFYRPFRQLRYPAIDGYGVSIDPTLHATFARYLADGRPRLVAGSSFAQVVESILSAGYPRGGHELVAAVSRPAGGVLAAYDPAMAVTMAIGAFAAYWLVRRAEVGPALAAFAGVVAAAGYLQVGYYAEGFLPQMTATPFIFGAIGLAYEAVRQRRLWPAALGGVCAGAAGATYSLTVGLFIVPALVACVLVGLTARPFVASLRRVLAQAALFAAGALAVLAPVLGGSIAFVRSSAGAVSSSPNPTAALGNLVPGIHYDPKIVLTWVGSDFRLYYQQKTPTKDGFFAAFVLIAAALVAAAWRRRPVVPLVLGSCALASYVIASRSTWYYTVKSYQVLQFPVACAVVVGGAAIVERRDGWSRIVAAGLVTVLLGGWAVTVKRSLQLETAGPSPTPSWLAQLDTIGGKLGDTPTLALVNTDWAKIVLPSAANPLDLSDQGTTGAAIRPDGTQLGWADFDSFIPSSTSWVRAIIEPRLGGLSQPPPPFRVVDQTDLFRVYERPAASQLASTRVPLEQPNEIGGRLVEPGAAMTLPVTGGSVVRLAARPSDGILSSLWGWKLDGSRWVQWTDKPPYIVSITDGSRGARSSVSLTAGRYEVRFVGASSGVSVWVDGRRVGVAPGGGLDANVQVGFITLGSGRHLVSVLAGEAPSVSYGLAVSLQRVSPGTTGELCVGGRRYSASAARPVVVRLASTPVVRNCGRVPLVLDWLEPVPATGS